MLAGGLLILAAAAQSPGDAPIPPVTYPEIVRQAATVEGFVPSGWKLQDRATGDLNGDGLADAALVLRMDDQRNLIPSDWDPAQKYDSNPYMLVVASARKGGGYALGADDHRLIPRLENQNQEEPFDDIKIERGTVRIRMHLFMDAGGWQMGGSAYTFRWQDGTFRLIGFDRDEVHRGSGDTIETSVNYLSGKAEIKKGNISTDEQQSLVISIPERPLIALEAVGDGLMFEPTLE